MTQQPRQPEDEAEESRVVVALNGQTHELRLCDGETIFAAAHRAGLAPPFSCLAGYCGSCIASLEAGEVTMKVNMALSAKQVARGWILTCQAIPTSPRCRVDYPD
jgi:ferredoxin